jgi:predicted secreted Zn-dependent protease
MREAAPWAGQERAFGRTTWNVTWRAQWSGAPQCRVTLAEVQLRTRVTLPRWTPPAGAPPALVAQWGTFLRALAVHEAGHAAHGAEAAREVRRELERVVMPSCGMMQLRTRDVAEAILERYRARTRDYDVQTRHGATQGATWPPRRTAPDSLAS